MGPVTLIALFGEAERGMFHAGYLCRNLDQLFEFLGEPPSETRGLSCAVRALLYGHPLIYFRVAEEGFSYADYRFGFHLLESETLGISMGALYLPGVGSKDLIEDGLGLCRQHHSVLIVEEADFYDYLTDV